MMHLSLFLGVLKYYVIKQNLSIRGDKPTYTYQMTNILKCAKRRKMQRVKLKLQALQFNIVGYLH